MNKIYLKKNKGKYIKLQIQKTYGRICKRVLKNESIKGFYVEQTLIYLQSNLSRQETRYTLKSTLRLNIFTLNQLIK